MFKETADALDRDTTLHELLPRFNPYKLRDLQHVLTLREVYVDTDGGRVRLISDDDLKECYFEGAWQFQKDEFVLANWQEMSIEEMREKVRNAHPSFGYQEDYVYPPGKVDVDTLETKEEIVRAFRALTYVPAEVYMTAVAGAHVLRSVKAGDVENAATWVFPYLGWACRAGLNASVIRGLAEKCPAGIDNAAHLAVSVGNTDVLDLLASEFGVAEIGAGTFCSPLGISAVRWGQIAMIDHLVEQYGMDPNGDDDKFGWTVLHWMCVSTRKMGDVRAACTVKHLVDKHNVDIHKPSTGVLAGYTAADLLAMVKAEAEAEVALGKRRYVPSLDVERRTCEAMWYM